MLDIRQIVGAILFFALDPYHLSKHLKEALWYDEETYDKLCEAIYKGNLKSI
ncbi:hypothetical protein [Thermovenabulum gondwanense]|uniref:Uncharacterized protein n=1 Tax=Thermovenabulum gondwanense TaxID=520767 RepID=A0A162MRG7_9FIRM|nr:hypothetical protein [Thermovenabulum gondwanense]KYO67003.1 hypothetical protein ATZ99_08200 [Thermovenabulum gondwanense]